MNGSIASREDLQKSLWMSRKIDKLIEGYHKMELSR